MTAPCTVLVVDDAPANVALLEHLLTVIGYEVRTAVDAEDALASIALNKPRLLMTDIQLPGMSGLELAQHLKSDASTADICIIAVSAFAMAADERRAFEAGCDGFIAKPINTRKFPILVAAIVDRD